MYNFKHYLQSRSVSFIIISSCVTIVLVLVISILFATFASFSSTTREAVSVQTQELSSQIVYNYENYLNSTINLSNIVQTDIDQYDLEISNEALAFSSYLAEIIHLNSDILKIAVYDYDTGRCYASSDLEEMGLKLDDHDLSWFLGAIADPTVHMYSIPYTEGGEYKMNISKLINMQNNSALGVLKIEISFFNFINLVERSKLGEGGHINIIDPEYNVVYTSLPGGVGEVEVEVMKQIILGSRNVFLDGHNMTVNVDTLANTKWRICVFINIDQLNVIQQSFLITIVVVSLLVLLIGLLLFVFASRLITGPLKQLETAMWSIEKSDYFRTEEVELIASKEVAALTRRFNKMMIKISELMERVVTEQNAQRKSELKALQSQINPHFLYNTLDSIIWLVENNKNIEANEMVVALSRLFRISISGDREVITVRDEIEHVRNYLLIQTIRYTNAFDYTFDVDEAALEIKTMKLVLQPLVENCIYHGMKNRIDPGHICISARIEGDYLLLSVSDNGYGIRQETIDKLYLSFKDSTVSDSVGLKNIYHRVMIYYGGNAEMKIESVLDEGTTITIKEPLNRNENTRDTSA